MSPEQFRQSMTSSSLHASIQQPQRVRVQTIRNPTTATQQQWGVLTGFSSNNNNNNGVLTRSPLVSSVPAGGSFHVGFVPSENFQRSAILPAPPITSRVFSEPTSSFVNFPQRTTTTTTSSFYPQPPMITSRSSFGNTRVSTD